MQIRALLTVSCLSSAGRFRPLGKGIDDPNPPADYNLTAISSPVALYYSTNDGIIDPKVRTFSFPL